MTTFGDFQSPLSISMLEYAAVSDGTDLFFGNGSTIAKALSKSSELEEKLDDALRQLIYSDEKAIWVTGTINYNGSNDVDLWLSLGKVSYCIYIHGPYDNIAPDGTPVSRYEFVVSVIDIYNYEYHEYNNPFGINLVTRINNLASSLEDVGILTPYEWRCEFGGWVWVAFH